MLDIVERLLAFIETGAEYADHLAVRRAENFADKIREELDIEHATGRITCQKCERTFLHTRAYGEHTPVLCAYCALPCNLAADAEINELL